MSPSPDLSPQPPKSPLSNQIPLDEQVPTASELPDTNSSPNSSQTDAEETSPAGSPESTPLLRKPPVRPVRPQPPAQPTVPKVAVPSSQLVASQELDVNPPTPSITQSSTTEEEDQLAEAALRQRPIPPPSEPKQYRAIGLVRGHYTSSEEEFTRGTLVTSDGVPFNSVLLGRVMSLVRNHIDLEKEHLWVVYPRTREIEGDLHIQIVGVWEPETLKRDENDEAKDASEDASENASEDVKDILKNNLTDPSLEDGYFSVRGEVVFFSQEERHVVVKIQQSPRKNSQKGKMFKLSLQGDLDSPRTVGYFWDLHIKREKTALMITGATCIGLAPPKKKPPGGFANRGRPRRPSFGGDRGGGRESRPPGSSRPSPRREAAAKPIKRSEQNSEG